MKDKGCREREKRGTATRRFPGARQTGQRQTNRSPRRLARWKTALRLSEEHRKSKGRTEEHEEASLLREGGKASECAVPRRAGSGALLFAGDAGELLPGLAFGHGHLFGKDDFDADVEIAAGVGALRKAAA